MPLRITSGESVGAGDCSYACGGMEECGRSTLLYGAIGICESLSGALNDCELGTEPELKPFIGCVVSGGGAANARGLCGELDSWCDGL